MKNKLKTKVGSALTSLAVIIGFAAVLIFIINPGVDGTRLGAQAGKGGKGTPASVPSAPTINSVTAGDGEVDVVWSAPSSDGGAAVSSYSVKYVLGKSEQIVDTKNAGTTYTIDGLTNDSEYTFSVAAVNSAGTGSYSSTQTATPVGFAAPDMPTSLSAEVGDSQITLTWVAPVNDGGASITDYSVQHNDGSGPTTISTGATDTTYTVTGLSNDTEYSFKVFATNSVGDGTQSAGVVSTPVAAVSGPSAPTLSEPSVSDGSISLAWSVPSDDGGTAISGYTISYTKSGGSELTMDAGSATSYTLTDLVNGGSYTIKVRASNADADGDYSSTKTATPLTTPGVPSSFSITPGDGVLALSWAAPASNGSPITDYTISYTQAGGSEQTVSLGSASTSYTLEGLTNGVNYTIKVSAENSAGTSSYSSTATQAPDQNVAPAIVGVPTVIVSNTGAVVAWSTNKRVSSKVDFGLLEITASTPEYNKETRVLNHSVTVSNLLPCTTYSYQVKSYDASSQEVVSSKESFTTTGCATTAEVKTLKQDSVDTSVGGELDFTSYNVKTKLRVPANLKEGKTDVVFQVKKLEKTETALDIGKPEGSVEWLGGYAYNFSAYGSELEEVNDFDNAIDVTIEYSREDISGIDINTLKIHHYDEEIGWSVLSGCSNNYNTSTGEGEITCKTSSFSIFGLFGENASGGSSTGSYVTASSSSAPSVSADDSDEIETELEVQTTEVVTEETTIEDIDQTKDLAEESDTKFLQDLWMGMTNADVFALQKFLNANGFTLSQEGPGSPGRETSYFGNKTFEAVKRFQKEYADNILSPLGLNNPTGYLGMFTRTFINENY